MSMNDKLISVVIDQWNQFCSTTGLRGFSYLINSTYRWEKCLWMITVVFGICMTFWDVTESFKVFIAAPTITKLEMRSDRPFRLDNLTICMEFVKIPNWGINVSDYNEVEQFVAKLTDSLAATNTNLSTFIDKQIHLISDILHNVSAADSTLPMIFTEVVDDKFPQLLSLTTLMVVEITRREFLTDRQISNSSKLIKQFYKSQQIRQRDLLLNAGGYILCAMGLLVSHRDVNSVYDTDHYCFSDKIVWFGQNPFSDRCELCFAVEPTQLVFYSRVNKLRIKLRKANFFQDDQVTDIIFGPEFLVYPEVENLYFIDTGQVNSYFVKTQGHFQLISNCTPNAPSLVACKLNRIARCIVERNLCSPAFTAFLEVKYDGFNTCESVSYQTKDIFKDIKPWTTPYEIATKCSHDCTQPCERKTFSVAVKSEGPKTNVTIIEVSADSFISPYFEEKLAFTSRQFLGQLGGNLSLWMGAGFVILLHVVVFITKCIKTCRNLSTSYRK